MSALRLATRRSPLALAQAELVAAKLAACGQNCELVLIETHADQRTDLPLSELGGQGAFVVEVQRRVLAGDADLAVHSAKDLPGESASGLVIAAAPERADPRDVIVGRALAGLGPGATVATGSARRRALLLSVRPDLNVVGLRGNMATRLAAAGRDGVHSIVAARAALERLGLLDRVAEVLDVEWFTPQVGQGTIAVEAREDDERACEAATQIDDLTVHAALLSERAFLIELGGGCSLPLGAHATVSDGEVHLRAMVASPDGSTVLRAEGHSSDGVALGTSLARELRDERGGAHLEGWA